MLSFQRVQNISAILSLVFSAFWKQFLKDIVL